jgi:hypothetical protein
MTVSRGFKIYVVAIYYRDENTILHHYTNWRGEADSPGDAKYRALLALLAEERGGPLLSHSWKAEIFDDMQEFKP